MPQAPARLSHLNEGKCWATLAKNFKELCGIIYRKDPNYTPTNDEWDAVDYMVYEWDYGYSSQLPKSIQG